MTIAPLLGDPLFEVVGAPRRRRPLVPLYFESLPDSARQRALWLETHVSEVLDGVRAGSPQGTAPRREYDVTRTTMRQRELAKMAELQRLGQPIGLRLFQLYRHRYARAGLAALVGNRSVRRCTLTGRIDQRYLDAFLEVLQQDTTASTGTSVRLKRLVDKRVVQRHGANFFHPLAENL